MNVGQCAWRVVAGTGLNRLVDQTCVAESEGQQLVSDLLSTDVALGAWRVCAARAGSSGGAVLTVQRISELCLVCCCLVCYLGMSSR